VRRGRELFADQGCDRCHSIAAIGAGGKLGPRLDTLDADLDDNLESIAEPRHDIADG
jgi:mono/diheme cytochrome c family protein